MAASATHFLFAPASPPPRTPTPPPPLQPPPPPHTFCRDLWTTMSAYRDGRVFFVDVLFRTLYLQYLCSNSTCFYSIFAAISARNRAQCSVMKLVDNNAWNSAWLMLLAFPWEKRPHSQSCPSKNGNKNWRRPKENDTQSNSTDFSVMPFKKRKQKLKKAERKWHPE